MAISNADLISQTVPGANQSSKQGAHKKFRTNLAVQLFAQSTRQIAAQIQPIRQQIHQSRPSDHGSVTELEKQGYCKACISAKRGSNDYSTRKPLDELSVNTIRHKTRRNRPLYTHYRCVSCNVNICKKKRCWEEHIMTIRQH